MTDHYAENLAHIITEKAGEVAAHGAHGAHNIAHHMPEVVFGWDGMIVSSVILCLAYVFIISEKINRAVIAHFRGGCDGHSRRS